jgi:hypothetical protein
MFRKVFYSKLELLILKDLNMSDSKVIAVKNPNNSSENISHCGKLGGGGVLLPRFRFCKYIFSCFPDKKKF